MSSGSSVLVIILLIWSCEQRKNLGVSIFLFLLLGTKTYKWKISFTSIYIPKMNPQTSISERPGFSMVPWHTVDYCLLACGGIVRNFLGTCFYYILRGIHLSHLSSGVSFDITILKGRFLVGNIKGWYIFFIRVIHILNFIRSCAW